MQGYQQQQQYQEQQQDFAYRNLQWPGETAALGGTTSTMELLHGPQLMSEPSSSGKAPKTKRTRSALSCAECRRLKLRCSREPWPCSNCVKRKCGELCPEETLAQVRPSRTKEVGALLERIHELEYHLAELTAQQELAAKDASSRNQNYGEPSTNYLQGGSTLPSTTTSGTEGHHPGVADVAEVMGTLLLGDDGSSRYLGKSAANALFHDAGSDDEDAASLGSEEEDEAAYNLSMRLQGTSFPMVSKGLEVEDFQAMLPPISAARYKADCYYKNCAHMFEPLKREVFDKHLADAYDFGADPPLPLEQLALVFMVLALGISFDLHADIKDPRSPKYHSIAQACLTSAKFLNVPSLASIQCLHLMSTWQLTFHSQTGAFRAWPLLGLAGRMVLSTGIHRDGSIWAIPEPHLTIRRQLFYEIVSYDRFQSLILGRPYMLNSKHWDTIMPEPPKGRCIEGQPLEYARMKWQFAMLVGDLCDDCLSVGRPPYETILSYDRKIRAFKESLPRWLVFDANRNMSSESAPLGANEQRQLYQNHTMTVMLNETLLFLHRVAFANAIEHYSAEPLRSPWAQSVVSLCLEASRTLIAVARSAFAFYPKLAARWWHIQCHAFGAGVCFAAVCIKSPASALARLAWTELTEAVTLLESMSREGGHSRDLYPRLRKLRDQAQAKLALHENSHTSPTEMTHPAHNGIFNGGTSGQSSAGLPLGSETTTDHPHVKKEEDSDLAVLGAATRKLEGNFVQRHQVTRTHSGGYGTAHHANREHHQHTTPSTSALRKDTSPATAVQTSSRPKREATVSSHHTPQARSRDQTIFTTSDTAASAGPSSATTSTFFSPPSRRPSYNHEQLQGQERTMQQGLSYPLSPGSTSHPASTGLQVYDNLDPGLADLLASISDTSNGNAREPNMEEGARGSAYTAYAVPSAALLPVQPILSHPPSGFKRSQPTPDQLNVVLPPQTAFGGSKSPVRAQPVPPSMANYDAQHRRASLPVSVSGGNADSWSEVQHASPGMNYAMQRNSSAVATEVTEDMGGDRVPGQSSTPSQYSLSPGHEYFQRHPPISIVTDVSASLPDRRLVGPAPLSAGSHTGSTPMDENSYLDTAWMDYFPTPGVGLFQQQPAPITPSYPISPPAQQPQHQQQPQYFQQQLQRQQMPSQHTQQLQLPAQPQSRLEGVYYGNPQMPEQHPHQPLRFPNQQSQQQGTFGIPIYPTIQQPQPQRCYTGPEPQEGNNYGQY